MAMRQHDNRPTDWGLRKLSTLIGSPNRQDYSADACLQYVAAIGDVSRANAAVLAREKALGGSGKAARRRDRGLPSVGLVLAIAAAMVYGCTGSSAQSPGGEATASRESTRSSEASPSALPSPEFASPSATPGPTATYASSSTSAVSTARPFDVQWLPSSSFPKTARPVEQLNLSGIVAAGKVYVAYGAVILAGDDAAAARNPANNDISAGVWTSPDGVAWHQATDAVLAGARMWAAGVSPTGGVVLSGLLPPASGSTWDSAVWTSTDQVHWHATRIPSSGSVMAVAWDGKCVVASAFDTGGNGLWTSCNGGAWQKGRVFGTTARVDLIELVPFGFLALVERSEGSTRHLVIVVSNDGLHWQDQPIAGDDVIGANPSVVATPGGVLIAAGTASNDQPAAFWRASSDGSTWTQEDPASTLKGAYIDEGTACKGGVAVVGVSGRTSEPATFISTDGRSWFEASTAPEFGIVDSIAALDDQIVALISGAGFRHTIWIGRIIGA